jgi:hypothetical protein
MVKLTREFARTLIFRASKGVLAPWVVPYLVLEVWPARQARNEAAVC